MLKQIIGKLFGNRAKESRKDGRYITKPADDNKEEEVKLKPFLNSKQVAENNMLECLPFSCLIKKVDWNGLSTAHPGLYNPNELSDLESGGKFINQYYLFGGRYLLFHPANDGNPTCPFEWYMACDDVRIREVLNNQTAFDSITNLAEILYKMISLYERTIDDDIVLDSMTFALKLTDDVCPNYNGRAQLVLTEDTVCTTSIHEGKMKEAKAYFISEFLDHFIGWNFGKVVKDNPRLEKKLLEFNDLVIKKDLRVDPGPGFEVWHSDKVVHYDLRKT